MKCPRTGKEMISVDINSIKIDVSTGCGGVWFDQFEFKKFDEPFESAGEQLIAAAEKYFSESFDRQARIFCPNHPDMVLRRYFFSVKKAVQVDECPQCGGIWLDPGELKHVRSLFSSEAEKIHAADQYFKEFFSSPEAKALQLKSQEDLKKSKRFAGLFKFLCPSSYIPGEQNWGAF